MKFMITATVKSVRGWQHFTVDAPTKEEALKNLNSGGGEFYDEELNVEELCPVTINDVDEFEG